MTESFFVGGVCQVKDIRNFGLVQGSVAYALRKEKEK